MKTLLLSCLLGLVTTVASNASSINFDTGGGLGHMFVTNTSVRLPIGSIVRMGTLTTAGDAASFSEFARTTINNTGGASTFTGFLRDGVTIATQAEADAIKGKQIYLFVYNTNNPALLDVPTTERGLFTATEWTLPAAFDSAATTSFNVKVGAQSGLTPPAGAAALAPQANATMTAAAYNVGTITINTTNNPNGSIYMLAGPIIPEPSTTVLAGVIGLMALGRRKRNA